LLVLTRKVDERICIGDDIVIVVTRISGDRVSIGITAPEAVVIRREELPPAGIDVPKGVNKSGQPRDVPPPAAVPVRRRRFNT
jgi:carbon storage regulator